MNRRFAGPTDEVRFRYDLVWERAQWQCPHMNQPTFLPSGLWTIQSIAPLTIVPSIWNSACGCHGFVTQGQWIPTQEAGIDIA